MVVVTDDEIAVPASFWSGAEAEAPDAEPPHPSN